MKFSTDWFSHHEAQWRELMAGMQWRADQPLAALEIGSFEGRSSTWLLRNVLVHPESRLFCVDSFEGGIEHGPSLTTGLFERFQSNITETGYAHKVCVRRGYSGPELIRLIHEGERFDFIYIDGSHQARDVLEDLVLAFRAAKVGCLILCDDYIWSMEPPGREDILNSPKLAVDAFTSIYSRQLRLVRHQRLNQLAFIKTQD